MPLSTSSSSRLPGGRQWRTWVLLPVVLVVMLCGVELIFRQLGFLPSLVDSPELWSIHRDGVYSDGGQKRMVIVGASRAQTALDPQVFAQEFTEYQVVHLAIDGTAPLEIVRDLCRDPKFDGLILCSATVPLMISDDADPERRDRLYVDYYRTDFKPLAGRDREYNALIKARLQSWAAIMSSELSFKNLVSQGRELKPNFLHMHHDRYRPANYRSRMTSAELSEHLAKRVAKQRLTAAVVDQEKFDQYFGHDLPELHRELSGRGGQMVLIRMPSSGESWTIEQEFVPKSSYWDRIQDLSGVPTVHFADFPGLDEFDCPDGIHLDATDAPRFTRRLSEILRPIFLSE